MTQESSPQKLVEALLQSLEPSAIADESLRRTVSILLNRMGSLGLTVIFLSNQKNKLIRALENC